jgi:ribosomal protein L22
MAEEKKDTEKKQSSTRRSTAKKSSGGSGGRKAAARSGGSGTRSSTRKRETATRGKGAAEATSKTADSKASATATSKAPAKKAAEKKPPAKKPDAKQEPAKKPAAKPKATAKRTTKSQTAATKTAAESPERPVVSARARFVRVAPRKARLIADQVRGLPLDDALPLLRFSTRSAAQDIRKLIESAAANAENNHDLVADDLMIKDIHVDEGPTLRRYRPRALGRATRINKRTSHIAVALTPEE